MLYFSIELLLRMRVTEDERQSLEKRALELLALNDRATREGLLSLEDDIPTIADPFFKAALMLVMDGYGESFLETALTGLIFAEAPRGLQLLRMLLEAEAAVSLSLGEPSVSMMQRIGCYLGPDSILRLAATARGSTR